MTRSSGTPADAADNIGEAKTALKAILRSVDSLREVGLEADDKRDSNRTPSRTGSPALGDARSMWDADGPACHLERDDNGRCVHDGPCETVSQHDTSKSLRGRYQRSMRHLADAVYFLASHTDVADGTGGALLGANVIADTDLRRAPHLLPTVDFRDAERMVYGLTLMLTELEHADLLPQEAHALNSACDEVQTAKRELPGWTRKGKRHAQVRRCEREGCQGRDGKPRKVERGRTVCAACRKREQRLKAA